jgi:hypothetical protein
MRTLYVRTLALSALTLLAFAGSAGAQQPAPEVLPAPQVRELMAGQQPADHARLRGHFDALAAKYAAEANRHTAFAQASAGVPRGAGASAGAHHTRLAANANESARVLRELAVHHGQLGAGVTSTAPRTGERFERGAGAPATPNEKQLLQLAAKAQTPSEHGLLTEYYTTLLARYAADAKEHKAMAQAYQGLNRPNPSAMAHCERLVALANDSLKETQALIDQHKRRATGR